MTAKKMVTGLLVVSMALSSLPALAEGPVGAGTATIQPAAPDAFRASLDHAAKSLAVAPGTPDRPRASESNATRGQVMPAGGGGGMKATTIILMVVGTAAGLATTYYALKQMKKIEGSATH